MTQQTPLQPNIDQIRDLLSPYLDGEVTDAERRQVETALVASAELQAELNALQNTVALLSALPDMPAPRPFTLTEADVAEFSRSSLREKSRFRIPTWLWGLGTAAAAMICVLAAGGILFSAQFGGSNSAPAAEVAMQQEAAAPDANLAKGEAEATSGEVAPAVEEKSAAEPPLTTTKAEAQLAAPPAPEIAPAQAEQAAPAQPAAAAEEESGAEMAEGSTADTVEEMTAAEAAPPADAADDTAMPAAPAEAPSQESAKSMAGAAQAEEPQKMAGAAQAEEPQKMAGAAQAEEPQKEEAAGQPAATSTQRSAAQAPLPTESLKEATAAAPENETGADRDQSGPVPQQAETEATTAPQLTALPTAVPPLAVEKSPFPLWLAVVILLALSLAAVIVTGVAVVLLRRKR